MEQSYRWQKDPVLENLLDAEVGILKRGLGSDFELLELTGLGEGEERVVALGYLKYSKTNNQAVQISFPTKYPYSPPRVIAVSISIDQNRKILGSAQSFNFGRGNQYNDGTLCLFRKEFWNPSEHKIGWVLRRAQKGLESATSKSGFTPEENVEEYASPLKHTGQVLIPKQISLPKSAVTGELILTQFKPNCY
ncbi:MAG: hypothetical protein RIB86_06315, partial [Imperialibacter sp.]